jgi:hypothetical protein
MLGAGAEELGLHHDLGFESEESRGLVDPAEGSFETVELVADASLGQVSVYLDRSSHPEARLPGRSLTPEVPFFPHAVFAKRGKGVRSTRRHSF